MASKSLLKQFIKVSCSKFLKFNAYTASKCVTKTTHILNATKSLHCDGLVKYYCSNINNIPIVSYDYIKQLENHPEVLLIDVREPEELQQTGQIPTSINIPLGQVADELGPGADKRAFKAKYGRDKPERNTEIVFHCKIGKRSQNAAELAKDLGYQNTKNYLGSWTEWAEKEGLTQ